MELKYIVILSVFGAVTGFTVPNEHGETSSDLESSFPKSLSGRSINPTLNQS